MKKVVVILSGGMDSTTLTYYIHKAGYEIHCLSFDYGQKHARELRAAAVTCAKLGLSHHVVPFGEEMKFLVCNSALTDPSRQVPEGHYADETMKATVVPNRNMIMLSLAAGYAINIGASAVAYAAHAGDHTIYPDCRPEFADAVAAALALCHFTPIELLAPFMHATKNDICVIGTQLSVPFEDTWTCYAGGAAPCGECGACRERAEAFEFAGVKDPLLAEVE